MYVVESPMAQVSLALQGHMNESAKAMPREARAQRLENLVNRNVGATTRALRNLGMSEAELDDAVQQVFLVALRRLDAIDPDFERSFLYRTAVRVASRVRRTRHRRRENADVDLAEMAHANPGTEELLDQSRARALLDRTLDKLSIELRTVFVLFELEEITVPQIAEILSLPVGTVASRLRRAREEFDAEVTRVQARLSRRVP